MLPDLIILPPLLALVITIPWWLGAVFRWWLGLVCPSWDDHAHDQSRRPAKLHVMPGGAVVAASPVPQHAKPPRHLRLIRGDDGDALDWVA